MVRLVAGSIQATTLGQVKPATAEVVTAGAAKVYVKLIQVLHKAAPSVMLVHKAPGTE